MKRQRGRNRKNNSGNNSGNRSFDSNGPDVKVRGSANTVYDKYITLANDAQSSGNRVKAENLRQHAEHYFRIAAKQEAAKQAAREEAEAKRQAQQQQQASNDDNNDKDGDDQNERRSRRQPRARHDKKADSNGSGASDGLKVVTPEASDEAPKPTRRRRAPAKPKTDEAAETAAE